MEIQGLSDAQNNHSQHGALHGSTFSELSTKSTPRSEFISAKTEVGGLCEPRSDNNNNRRPTTVPFCSRPENGSTMDFSPPGEPEPPDKRLFVGNTCSNVNFKKQSGTQLSPEASLSCGAGAERQEKMALPGSEEMPLSSAALRTENLLSSAQHPDCDYKDLQQLYVVFTVTPNKDNIGAGLSSAGVSEETCVSAAALDKDRDHTRYSRSMEDENSGTDVFSEDRGDRSLPETHTLDINDQSFCLPDQSFNTKLPDYHKTVEDIFSRKCFDKLPALSSADMSVSKVPVNSLDEGSALVSVDSCLMETANSPDGITVCGGLQDSANPVTMPPGSSTESFSGTIMINNQSIIVTIDNGLVTLSTPPEGYPHKEDDLVSLKEHLGMKDYEDVVLLNYDGGTKAIGKINTLTASSSSQIKDSELPLMEDCSTMYSFTEADLISPSPKAAVLNVDNEEAQSPIKSKKEIIAFYDCPESGCSATFLSRRKLKVHLLNHAEDKRPFQCTVEGCGWAFTTSYKLKRHIQSHDKQRPFECTVEGCDRRFTTVYNLKAHVKNHKQDDAFACDLCSERFRSATRLASHQRVHFEPQRNHKCEFPGCEKTFMTFSAMFSHNRSHFRESGHFVCSFPGCEKTYDKACRLKIHLRSHTGERPFVCDSGGCGWSFTSMSKLLRHKRKHDDDRRFVCTEEGCGKSFTRAEHLKGHSITHLGTKPFQCHAEGCNAKFSARSSLYIHSKKHKQDASSLRTRCPVDNCIKHFSSRSSLKSHMLKCHHISPDMLSQMEMTPTLTPSSELVSPSPALIPGAGPSGDQMTSLDLSSLLSGVAASTVPTAGINVGIPVGGTSSSGMFTMDLSMVNSGILTIDPSSVGALSSAPATALAKTVDPLLLTTATEVGSREALERSVEEVLPPQGTLNLDDVQSVTPEALGSLSGLSMQSTGVTVDALSVESTAPVVELLASLPKGPEVPVPGQGSLLSCVEVMETQEGEKVLTQFVFPAPNSTFSPQKDSEHGTVSCSFLESGGSARTDYRAIQLAKKRKQSAPASGKRGKFVKAAAGPLTGAQFGESTMSSNTALNLRDVHIQLLQDDPASDGDLAFQLSSQPSSSHTQLTVDLPVNILQEPSGMPEDDTGSENSQFTGSTINLQDLE